MNPYGLAHSVMTHKGSSEDFSVVAPCLSFSLLTKLVPDSDKDVEVRYVKGDKASIAILSQPFCFGGKEVGKALFRIACSQEPFRKFEKTISALNYKNSIRFVRSQAQSLLNRVSVFKEDPHVVIEIDSTEKTILFRRDERRGAGMDGGIPLKECKSESFAVVAAFNSLQECFANADADEIGIDFTGLQSLSRFSLGPKYYGYLQMSGAPKNAETA